MPQQHVLLEGSRRPHPTRAAQIAKAIDPEETISITVSLRGAGRNENPEQRRADAEKVKEALGRYGLRVKDERRLEAGSIEMEGKVKDANSAFRTDLKLYHGERQGEFRGREGELSIPAELDGIVTGVFGLDKRRVARRRVFPGSGNHGSFTPRDLEEQYQFPEGAGAGQKIGILEFGGCYFDEDTATFCRNHGLPQPAVGIVPVGYTPPRDAQQLRQLPPQERRQAFEVAGEVMMDVQIVVGLCPEADISVYFAEWDQKGWIDLLDTIILEKPVSVSVSYGLAEDHPDWSQLGLTEIDKRLAGAAALGITVCISSGDDGSGDQMDDNDCHTDFPASSPHVLGVGGSMILKGGQETSWWTTPGDRRGGGGATGGGVSRVFDRPAWQNVQVASLNENAIDGRVVPDVAALAGPPFYDLTFAGQSQPSGGTSASAPLWAALIARINALLPAAKQQRFLTPLLYGTGTNSKPLGQHGCRDISSGHDNRSTPFPGRGYEVRSGYDAVTGFGVPFGTELLKALETV
ncbi:protease pro-enzyme activation domain-containing protein [Streptomyces sp. NPDC006739]|uniref:S53 family peptidase n=1 Tax=Streptomyces sp. NPDC006739 TaxID=3364763 RepID=UPI00367C11AB